MKQQPEEHRSADTVPTPDRGGLVRTLAGAVVALTLLLPGIASSQETVTVSIDRDRAMPPSALVSTKNPSSGAILRHEVDAIVDPEKGTIRATDRLFVLHAPGTSIEEAFPVLLWRDLELLEVRGEGVEVVAEERERMRPKSFWKRPPYASLGGYETARQIDLSIAGAAGSGSGSASGDASGSASGSDSDSANATWPDTTIITMTYEGVIVDSLHPPEAAYARSFETTVGLILPEGAFLAYSSFWIPTRPEEVFTFDLTVTTPPDWRSVSQGRMAKDVRRDGQRQMRWDCPHPMEEIYLVAGPYEENHLRHGDVMAQTFTYADTDSSIYNRYLRGTGAYLDLYEEKVGPYPFAKFALVENFWQSGYGMPSFTLLGDRVIRLPFILDTSYGHEILHNWWGNGVFVDRDGGNWCEGLTTYGADYFYEERKGEEAASRYRLNALQNYRDYVSEAEDLPLVRFRERHDFTSQAVGYSKSMMVIHQLRRAVGDAAFDQALQDFYRRQLWKAASWTDLFTSFSRFGDVDPETWRSQWIERSGAPVLRMENVTVHGDAVHRAVTLDVVQEPMDGGDPYVVHVPIRVTGADDRQVDEEIVLVGERTSVTVACGFEPDIVAVDPDFHVMRRLHREEIPTRLSQVLGADSVAIVVADGLGEDVRAALDELAGEWKKGQRAGVFEESEIPETLFVGNGPTAGGMEGSDVAYWFLGRGSVADRVLGMSAVPLTLDPSAGTRSVVLTGAVGDHAWGLLDASRPEDVAALGRKVPHYGKYSYLVFDDGNNVDKGIWPAGESPLRHELAQQ